MAPHSKTYLPAAVEPGQWASDDAVCNAACMNMGVILHTGVELTHFRLLLQHSISPPGSAKAQAPKPAALAEPQPASRKGTHANSACLDVASPPVCVLDCRHRSN